MARTEANEPRQSQIESATRAKWPDVMAVFINHRKHTMRLTFPSHTVTLRARSHRGMLGVIERAEIG